MTVGIEMSPKLPGGHEVAAATLATELLRIKLDNQLLCERRRLYIFALGQSHDLGLELFAVLFEPGNGALALRHVARFEDHGVIAHAFLDGDLLADVNQVRRNVDFLSGHPDVAMPHELTSLRA